MHLPVTSGAVLLLLGVFAASTVLGMVCDDWRDDDQRWRRYLWWAFPGAMLACGIGLIWLSS